jgi:hypothetical protein
LGVFKCFTFSRVAIFARAVCAVLSSSKTCCETSQRACRRWFSTLRRRPGFLTVRSSLKLPFSALPGSGRSPKALQVPSWETRSRAVPVMS